MENPHVDCIGHLTGRKINKRAPGRHRPRARDREGARDGTFLEINSQPDRLDLRDAHARLAAEAGVTIPVSTDAHEVSALGHMQLGIAQARRAWLTKQPTS